MFDLSTVLFFSVVFLITAWLLSGRSYKNLPPGPSAWPIFGNLWGAQANKRYHLDLYDLAKKYGDIFCVRYGNRPVVVLNGAKRIREALVTKADYFSDRPDDLYLMNFFTKGGGIIWNAHDWKHTRKFALVALKDFGLGRASLEERCQDEAVALMEAIDEKKGKSFDPQLLLQNSVSNIICSVVFGQRFAHDDADFQKMTTGLTQLLKTNNLLALANVIPVLLPFTLLSNVIPFMGNPTLEYVLFVEKFIYGKIKEHRQTYDPEEIRDFLDLYIQSEETGKLAEPDALRIIMDLFFAGTETTSTSLRWLIIYMIHYPEVQRKCRQEIHDVIGTSRPPNSKDRASLVYIDATLKELLRITTIAPLGLPHAASTDVEMGGYVIPKGTQVIMNLYSALMDPTVWDEPEKFSPERWIDAEGKPINHESYIPFSLGRRICLGEQLARMELFIFGVSLLQRFELKSSGQLPSVNGEFLVTLGPKPYEFTAERI